MSESQPFSLVISWPAKRQFFYATANFPSSLLLLFKEGNKKFTVDRIELRAGAGAGPNSLLFPSAPESGEIHLGDITY